jgi:hypothetical protein
MLRIRLIAPADEAADRDALLAAEPAPMAEIIRDFADPYLELVRLLREASEIEHALLVQYLYGAFSVKPAYPLIKGFGFASARDLLGVAVQEMQHLHQVNRLLVTLGAAPNLVRQDFPYEPDIYPFPLNLEPLSPSSLAKYVYTEAAREALDPASATDREDAAFLTRLFAELGDVRPNHLGSLYRTILDVIQVLIADPPSGLGDLSGWPARLEQIRSQGEGDHFRFFRQVFLGTHRGFGGRPDIWSLPRGDPAYPAFPLPVNPSAFNGHPQQIQDPTLRELAWLGNLHYWLILCLLDLGYRTDDAVAMGLAKDHMIGPLLELGDHLANLGIGLPFDPLSMGYALGVDRAATLRLVLHLVDETEAVTQRVRDELPPEFSFGQTKATRDALDAQVLSGRDPSRLDGGGRVNVIDVATQFWFDFDDHFLFNPTPEILDAYTAIRGLNFIPTRWREHRRSGTYPDGFIADVEPLRDGLAVLSGEQLAIIRRHFGDDEDAMRRAFEAFGQGILFDDRRPPGFKVHMMDSSGPANPPIGYHRWHPIIRAVIFLGIDAAEWGAVDRLVGLAWAIHSEATPVQDTRNPGLSQERLEELRGVWLGKSLEELDDAFDSFPFPT